MYVLSPRYGSVRSNDEFTSYGVAAGAEALASSLASGVEGVVVSLIKLFGDAQVLIPMQLKPIEGAESEGAKGFFKGVGKGLIG